MHRCDIQCMCKTPIVVAVIERNDFMSSLKSYYIKWNFSSWKVHSKSHAGISLPNLRVRLAVKTILESFGFLKLNSTVYGVLINFVLCVSIN